MARRPDIYKVVSLFDIHYWEHIDLDPILEFIRQEKPNEIILGWDQIDLFTISKYYKWDKEQGIYDAQKEIKEFKKFLKKLNKASPDARIVWLDWNHEYRLWEYMKHQPDRIKLLDYEAEYAELVDEFVRYNDFYKVGKLYYTHWIYHNDSHAKKHAVTVQRNLRYWHLHCFDDKTELLTEQWFKFFEDLDINEDKAVTYNIKTEKLEYNKINDQVTYTDYKKLLTLDTRNINLAVTPDHWVVDFRSKIWPDLKKMSEMKEHNYWKFKCAWQLDRKPIDIEDSWLKLLIRIVADWHIDWWKRITFHFNKTRKIEKINEILDSLWIKYSNNIQKTWNTKIHINLKNTPISKYLEYQNKRLPSILRKANKHQANIILEEYTASDWCRQKKWYNSFQLSSSNYSDCNILHEIFVTNWIRCNLTTRKQSNRNKTWRQAYILSVNTDSIQNEFKTNRIKEVSYEWNVSCVSVDNWTLLVRRDGKTCITQNTYQSYTNSTPVWDEAHVTKALPCLCKKSPDYMKNKPNAWLNWFNIAYIYWDWNFNDYTIFITDWKFYFNNKWYG